MEYADFWTRLVAALIDGFILSIGSSIFWGPFRASGFQTIIGALYVVLLWVNWNGQTIGKKIMKIKVVREDGKPLEYREAIIRYVCYFVSAIPVGLGFLWVLWDEKKQGWHDKLAKTYVVKE